jgi:hypothetical protein
MRGKVSPFAALESAAAGLIQPAESLHHAVDRGIRGRRQLNGRSSLVGCVLRTGPHLGEVRPKPPREHRSARLMLMLSPVEQIGGDREIETASCPARLFGDAHLARNLGGALLRPTVMCPAPKTTGVPLFRRLRVRQPGCLGGD